MPTVASTTNTAISVLFKICRVFCTRSAPSAPVSSKPGVSMISTGPKGSSSIAFCTGSVVVPLTSETTESAWPVTALTTLDLPALRRPKKPIWSRSPEGVAFMLITIILYNMKWRENPRKTRDRAARGKGTHGRGGRRKKTKKRSGRAGG